MHPITQQKNSVSWMRRSAIAVCLALPLFAQAQAWPNKPIKWIIPYTPGGITDNARAWWCKKSWSKLAGLS